MDDGFIPHRLMRDTVTGELRCGHCGAIILVAPDAPLTPEELPETLRWSLIRLGTEPCPNPMGQQFEIESLEPIDPLPGPFDGPTDSDLPVYRSVAHGTFTVRGEEGGGPPTD
jgi:hypothetical protein